MSARYHRQFARAEHDMAVDEIENGYGAGNSPSTTITVVEVRPASNPSTSIPSYSMTFQSRSLASISLETTTAATITETNNTQSSQTPTSFISLASSISPSSSTLSPPPSSGTPLLQDTKISSVSSLNPSAIVGVMIACIFIFLVGIFFAVRVWFKKKRMAKLRKTWPRSSVVGIRYGTDAPESSYEPKLALRSANSRPLALSVQIPSPHVSVPCISYNNDAVFQHATLPVSSSPSSSTSPIYSPGLTIPSPYSTTVVCTFIPSLPDELTIFVGETLRVLAEYEDGWSLCMNCRGQQGMVPNECLDRSSSSVGLLPPKYVYRIPRSSTRVTSLTQAIRPGR